MPMLEEIDDAEDIDNLEMDLAEFDPSLKTPILPAKPQPSIVRSQDGVIQEPPLFPSSVMQNNPILENLVNQFQKRPETDESQIPQQQLKFTEEEIDKIKHFQLIYPCYFDKRRSVKQGRRVNKKYAVENPLLKTIMDCCLDLKIEALFEPSKTHPQDFGNPGRVRILLKDNGDPRYENYPTKRSLFKIIGQYLQLHKTTWSKVKELSGGPEFKDYKGHDVPRVKGFQMNEIVPLHSQLIYQSPSTEMIYKKEFMEKPKPITPNVPIEPVKPKAKYMRAKR